MILTQAEILSAIAEWCAKRNLKLTPESHGRFVGLSGQCWTPVEGNSIGRHSRATRSQRWALSLGETRHIVA